MLVTALAIGCPKTKDCAKRMLKKKEDNSEVEGE
jgi:hypothetical protein